MHIVEFLIRTTPIVTVQRNGLLTIYVPMLHGRIYLTATIEWYNRKIARHYLSDMLVIITVKVMSTGIHFYIIGENSK